MVSRSLNQKLMWKLIYQALNGYALVQICHLYSTCISQLIQNHSLAIFFFFRILKRIFSSVLPEFFTPQVMLNWKSWMVKQQQLWDPLVYQQNPSISTELSLPRPQLSHPSQPFRFQIVPGKTCRMTFKS